MASRGNSKAKQEIIDMLIEDHKRVKRAFREAEKLVESEDMEALQELVEQTCADLQVHATLEEELFYPAVRESIKEAELVDEAEIEHMSAKELIAQIEGMQPDEPKYAAAFKVLGEYIKHHIKEEEGEMFKQLERSRVQWEPLLQEMQQRRLELLEEHGLEEVDEDAEEEETGEESAEPMQAQEAAQPARGRRGRRGQERVEEEETEAAE
jgi:hemerythrin superfamily protein